MTHQTKGMLGMQTGNRREVGRWLVRMQGEADMSVNPNLWCHGGRDIAIAILLVSAEHQLRQDDIQEERLRNRAWSGGWGGTITENTP